MSKIFRFVQKQDLGDFSQQGEPSHESVDKWCIGLLGFFQDEIIISLTTPHPRIATLLVYIGKRTLSNVGRILFKLPGLI